MGRVKPVDVSEGCFLTDGQHLYQVLRTVLPNGQVMLEDCGEPSAPAMVCTVGELVAQGMTVVRPAKENVAKC